MPHPATASDPLLPDVKMNLVTPRDPCVGRVVSTELCMRGKSASFVRHMAFDVSGTPLAGSFLAGQSFGVIAPGIDERGKPHAVRLYSIACPRWGEDGAGNVVSTTPKRLIDERKPQSAGDAPDDHRLFLGVCSNYLCDLRVGDEVRMTGPSGKRFLLPANPADHDYVFIATGTGIAPFRGMAMELLQAPGGPCPSQVHLLMGTPYTTDLLYDDLFNRLAAEHRNFHYHTAVSRERQPDGSRGIYVDRILELKRPVFQEVLSSPRTLVYICGILGMQVGIYQAMARLGVAEGYVTLAPEIASVDPSQWTAEQVKRHTRATRRCMVEVY
jgi:ferredoxin--NADP+ reductase